MSRSTFNSEFSPLYAMTLYFVFIVRLLFVFLSLIFTVLVSLFFSRYAVSVALSGVTLPQAMHRYSFVSSLSLIF